MSSIGRCVLQPFAAARPALGDVDPRLRQLEVLPDLLVAHLRVDGATAMERAFGTTANRLMRNPGGSLMCLRLPRIASAFPPVCGTAGKSGSVVATAIGLSFSRLDCAAAGETAGASADIIATSPTKPRVFAAVSLISEVFGAYW